jgi:hypothetical protein
MDGAAGASAAADAAAASGAARRAAKARIWKLKRFEDVVPTRRSDVVRRGDEERAAADFEDFLREIEEDPALRSSIALYKNTEVLAARAAKSAAKGAAAGSSGGGSGGAAASAPAAAGADSDEEDEDDDGAAPGERLPEIGLEELLDDMSLGGADAAGGDGEAGAAAAAAAAPAAAGGAGSSAPAGASGKKKAPGLGKVAKALAGTDFAAPGARVGAVPEAADGEEDDSDGEKL